jgi:hypothetical protein
MGILQEHRSRGGFVFGGSRANTAPARGAKVPLDIFEDADAAENPPSKSAQLPVLDDEVERFMRGQVSPSKKGDVDAVAGLLSLSQGNWR